MNKKQSAQVVTQPDTKDTEGDWSTGTGTFQKDTFEHPDLNAVASVAVPVPAAPPAPNPRLLDIDKAILDLAEERRKTALAQNESAELAYKYVILQLYMKYGLTQNDAINTKGEILIGGALPKQG